jgi:hypothetical protein
VHLADFYFTSLEFETGKAIIDVQCMFVNLKASLGPGERREESVIRHFRK